MTTRCPTVTVPHIYTSVGKILELCGFLRNLGYILFVLWEICDSDRPSTTNFISPATVRISARVFCNLSQFLIILMNEQ